MMNLIQRKTLNILVVCLGFFTWLAMFAYAEELTGRQIMDKVDTANETDDMSAELTMKLINKRGQQRVRTITMVSKKDKEGSTRSMVRFLSPADVKGTGFLTIEHEDAPDDQWLWLPALRRVRRIASSEKSGSFMGTDFTYGDMGSRKLDDYNYKLLRSEELDGVDCYVVESTPKTEKTKDETGYSKSEVWVRKDNYVIIQGKFYDKDGDFLKIMHATNIQKIDGKVWMPMNLEMQNVQKNHRTLLTFNNIKVDTGVSDEFFTQRYLKRGR